MHAFPLPTVPWAVFFDLDGTLIHSEPEVQEVLADVLLEHGRPMTPAERAFVIGHAWGEIDQMLRRGAPVPLSQQALEDLIYERRVVRAQRQGIPILPGAVAAVQTAARHVPVALVTGSSRAEAEMCLGALGIRPLFQALFCAGEYPRGKPAPDPYLVAAKALSIPPDKALVIEDSTAGIAAARAAGIPCIAVRAGNFAGQDQSQANLIIDRLSDLSWPWEEC